MSALKFNHGKKEEGAFGDPKCQTAQSLGSSENCFRNITHPIQGLEVKSLSPLLQQAYFLSFSGLELSVLCFC
jgi:hypothetical protein